jgi:subtilase family serine protease
MFRTRTLIAAVGATATVVGMTIVGASASAGAAASPARTLLNGSVAPFTSHTAVIGNAPTSKKLSVQLWLTPRTAAAAAKYALAVSTPGSSLFHHFLSPDAYTARFGASAASASMVEGWLRSQGFTGVHADATRSYVRATAPVKKINSAFRVQLKLYQSSASVNAGPYALRANNTAVSIPASLKGTVLGVTGLDNAAPVQPLDHPNSKVAGRTAAKTASPAAAPTAPCSQYYGQHSHSGPKHFGVTSWPTEACGYSATQLRAAYGANWTNTGKGQTVALVELGLTQDMFLTLQDYAKANHMPAPDPERYTELSLGQGTACGDDFDIEEQLDVEASYDMAPAASQLVVGGDSCNEGDFGLQGLFDADVAVLGGTGHHPMASAASNSWEGGDESQPASLTNIEHAYLVRSAAEGVGMYFSAGDGSGVETPSSDTFAIAVGGTTLGIGKSDNRLFETGWSTAVSLDISKQWVLEGEQGASGGGPSLLWKEPSYQKPVVPAALATAAGDRGGRVRSVPDISADADPFTGMAIGFLVFSSKNPDAPPKYEQEDIGGTSESSPLVAGIVTAAQQGQHHFGLVSPELYKMAGSSALFDPLPITSSSPASWKGTWCDANTCGDELLTTFDDQSPDMFGYTGQVTLKGYDNMSGVGTPDGQAFITALRKLEK